MRNTEVIVVILLIALLYPSPSKGQKNITGSGYVLTQQRETSDFTGIEISRAIKVFLVQGELKPITIEADDNLFPYIRTEVKNDVLKIDIPANIFIKKYADMNVFISLPHLNRLSATTAARIDANIKTWFTDKIDLKAATGAQIKLHVNTREIDVQAETSALIEIKGTTYQLNADIQASARLKAKELKTEIANIKVSNTATVEIEVNKQIGYDLSTGAQLIYKGNPSISTTNISTGARVTKEK